MDDSVIVSYATHAQGRYNDMMESNPNIIVGGWGATWNGFMDKFRFMVDFLSQQNPNDIVIFVDGFDTIIKGTKEEAVKRFKKIDCKMLLSAATLESTYPKLIRSRVFGTPGSVANSGLYMGYAGFMKEVLEQSTRLSHDEDDQKALNMILQMESYQGKGQIKVDTERHIFCNLGRNERSPEIYESIDAVFFGFNATFALDRNCARKMVNYCSMFLVEFIIIALASLTGFLALYSFDAAYNCCALTEIFGVVFPLTVIFVILHLDDEKRNMVRVVLAMAVLMLSFHVAFFLKKINY